MKRELKKYMWMNAQPSPSISTIHYKIVSALCCPSRMSNTIIPNISLCTESTESNTTTPTTVTLSPPSSTPHYSSPNQPVSTSPYPTLVHALQSPFKPSVPPRTDSVASTVESTKPPLQTHNTLEKLVWKHCDELGYATYWKI